MNKRTKYRNNMVNLKDGLTMHRGIRPKIQVALSTSGDLGKKIKKDSFFYSN